MPKAKAKLKNTGMTGDDRGPCHGPSENVVLCDHKYLTMNKRNWRSVL